jgi:hypothetical protein
MNEEENEAGESKMGLSLSPGLVFITRRFAFAIRERLGWWRESAAGSIVGARRGSRLEEGREVHVGAMWPCSDPPRLGLRLRLGFEWRPLVRSFGRLHCPQYGGEHTDLHLEAKLLLSLICFY